MKWTAAWSFAGSVRVVQGWRLAGLIMSCVRARMLAALCLAMCASCSRTLPFREAPGVSRWQVYRERALGVRGEVPLRVVVERLIELEVVKGVEVPPRVGTVELSRGATVADGVSALESAYGGVLGPDGVVRRAQAAHPVEAPDGAGRRGVDVEVVDGVRPASWLRVWFVRGGAAVDVRNVKAGLSGEVMAFSGLVTHGVETTWPVTTSREFFAGATSVDTGRFVATTRESVSAGFTLRALVGAAPGGVRRVTGSLEVSAFSGEVGTATGQVVIPIHYDLREGEVQRVLDFDVLNASMEAALRGLGLAVKAGSDHVSCWVEVEG